jgi:hypothetical protein
MTTGQLVELAKRKIGQGATVKMTSDGWIALSASGSRRAIGKTREALAKMLERMADAKK